MYGQQSFVRAVAKQLACVSRLLPYRPDGLLPTAGVMACLRADGPCNAKWEEAETVSIVATNPWHLAKRATWPPKISGSAGL